MLFFKISINHWYRCSELEKTSFRRIIIIEMEFTWDLEFHREEVSSLSDKESEIRGRHPSGGHGWSCWIRRATPNLHCYWSLRWYRHCPETERAPKMSLECCSGRFSQRLSLPCRVLLYSVLRYSVLQYSTHFHLGCHHRRLFLVLKESNQSLQLIWKLTQNIASFLERDWSLEKWLISWKIIELNYFPERPTTF